MSKISSGYILLAALSMLSVTTFSAFAEETGSIAVPFTINRAPKPQSRPTSPPVPSAPMGRKVSEWTNTVNTPNGVLNYDANTGAASIERVNGGGNNSVIKFKAGSFATGWTSIVYTKNGIFYYNSSNGSGALGKIDSAGNHNTIKTYPEGYFSTGWTSITNTPEGIQYRNSQTGAVAVGQFDSEGNHTTIKTSP